MISTAFYVLFIVIAIIFAVVIEHLAVQLKHCKDAQTKILEVLDKMLNAHEVTLESLRATDDYLYFLAENDHSHDEIQDRLYSRVSRLEEAMLNLQDSNK